LLSTAVATAFIGGLSGLSSSSIHSVIHEPLTYSPGIATNGDVRAPLTGNFSDLSVFVPINTPPSPNNSIFIEIILSESAPEKVNSVVTPLYDSGFAT